MKIGYKPKWEARHTKIINEHIKRENAGKVVWYQFIPNDLFFSFIKEYEVKAKKDKKGNIHITIKRKEKK